MSTAARTSEEDRGGSERRTTGLAGAAASLWFADHGLRSGAQDLHLFQDEIVTDGFRVGRVWHSAAALRSTAPRPWLLMLIGLEGRSEIRVGDHAVGDVLDPGSLAVVPPGLGLELSSTAPVARIEIELEDLVVAPATGRALSQGAVLHETAPEMRSVLSTAIHTALNSRVQPDGPGFPSFRLAVSHLALATLTAAVGLHQVDRSVRTVSLYLDACDIIARRAPDPAFSVVSLAAELCISERYLRNVFSAHGTTPRQAIREARTRLARHYFDPPRSAFTASEAARLSGFAGPRAMLTALDRGEPPQEDGPPHPRPAPSS